MMSSLQMCPQKIRGILFLYFTTIVAVTVLVPDL